MPGGRSRKALLITFSTFINFHNMARWRGDTDNHL